MRAFPVRLPSSVSYWTVLDDDLQVVAEADSYLRHLRLGRDAAEGTTKKYAEALALYLRWCGYTGRDWRAAEQLGGFMTWLQHAPSDPDAPLAGPGARPVRGPRQVNRTLIVVREFLRYQVAVGAASAEVLTRLYRISDDRHLPVEVRGERSDLRYVARPQPAASNRSCSSRHRLARSPARSPRGVARWCSHGHLRGSAAPPTPRAS